MNNTALQNIFYISSQLSFIINEIIDSEIVRNKFFKTTTITNSCCIENINSYLPYYGYYMEKNNEVKKIYDNLLEMNKNYLGIKNNISNKFLCVNLSTNLYNKKSIKQLPLHFKITPEEINNYFITFIDDGINIGKQHIYNNYDICILSNVLKSTIKNTTYSIHDFNKLRYTVYKNNMIKFKEIENTDKIDEIDKNDFSLVTENKNINLNNKEHAMLFLDYILDYVKDNKKLKILRNILGQIKTLITQTKIDITNLTKYLFNTKKDIQFYKEQLINLCDYKNLSEEIITNTNYKQGD